MNPFRSRLCGYIFLSLFLAFAAGPYTTQKRVSKTAPAVFLSAVALSEPARNLACLDGIRSVSELNLEAFPKIEKAIAYLSRWPIETNQVNLYGGNLGGFIRSGQSGKHLAR